MLQEYGFYFTNDGGAALEISVERFSIGHGVCGCGCATLARIKANDMGFVPIALEGNYAGVWMLDKAIKAAFEASNPSLASPTPNAFLEPFEIQVSVIYRDHNGNWYKSIAMMQYIWEALSADRIEFSATRQERFTPPQSASCIRGSPNE
jgi:hypothetical protein